MLTLKRIPVAQAPQSVLLLFGFDSHMAPGSSVVRSQAAEVEVGNCYTARHTADRSTLVLLL